MEVFYTCNKINVYLKKFRQSKNDAGNKNRKKNRLVTQEKGLGY